MAAQPIVHVEFPASDPKAAAQFYSDVFGWGIQVDPTFDYHMFRAEGGPGGGFVKVADGDSMGYKIGEVRVYIGSDDIDGDLAKVTAHGGTVVAPKTEIPQTGWFGVFKDPSGNTVAVFTPMQPQG